jgi:chromate transporter
MRRLRKELPNQMDSQNPQTPPAGYSLRQLTLYALKLGTIGFGGPVALIGYMHRDLVEERKWISEADYKDGLALAQLAPGPLAAQLAIYLGYVHYGVVGASLVGTAFVLPSFLMVLGIGWAYILYGGLSWMQSVFYAVGASVIGIIAVSAYRLTKKTVGKDRLLWTIYLLVMAVTVVTESEIIAVFLAAGVVAWLVKAPPKWLKKPTISAVSLSPLSFLGSLMTPQADSHLLGQVFWFFAKAGAFVFGSGLAIVPFLYGGVVKEYQWLNDRQFIDAVAVAMITPGPVVITVGFIGYLVAGFWGAVVAAVATFLPCYFFTILPAPYFKKYGRRADIGAFVAGVTAAATGAISAAVIVLGKRSIIDIPTLLMALTVAVVLLSTRKLTEPVLIAIAAIIGFGIHFAGGL